MKLLVSLIFAAMSFGAMAEEKVEATGDLSQAWRIEAQMERENTLEQAYIWEQEFAPQSHNELRRRRPPRRRPPRRRPPGYRPPPPERYSYICYAESRRGERFRAYGYSPRRAQRRAMDRCYDYAYRCYEMGCRRY